MKEKIDQILFNVAGEIIGRPEYGFASQRPTCRNHGEVSTLLNFEKAGGSSAGIILRYNEDTCEYYIGYYCLSDNGLEKEWKEVTTKDEEEVAEEFKRAVSQIPRYRLRKIVNEVGSASDLEVAISNAMSDFAKAKKEEHRRFGYPEEITEREVKILRDYITETFSQKR